MKFHFAFWAAILVLSLTAVGLCIRILATNGISLSESLMLRGASCLLLVFIFAHLKSHSLKPKALKTQFFRALIAGLALSFFSLSYKWLTASAVAVISNIDVPLLIVLGPIIGVATSVRARVLAVFSILCLVWYVTGIESQSNLVLGIGVLLVACFLLCLGYLFIKKSMNEENEAITILTPALAIIAYGIVERILMPAVAQAWTPGLFIIDIISGFGMFGCYIATMKLYGLADLATAEFPTLIASLVIQPLEAIFLNESMKPTYVWSSLAFVFISFYILKWQNQETEVLHAN